MGDKPDGKRNRTLRVSALVAGLAVVYVLSIGPVTSLVMYCDVQLLIDAQGTFYAPIYWLADAYEPLGDLYLWYRSFWP